MAGTEEKTFNPIIYKLMLIVFPTMVAILGTIGLIGLNALIKMSDNVSIIKTCIAVDHSRIEEQEKRITKLERP